MKAKASAVSLSDTQQQLKRLFETTKHFMSHVKSDKELSDKVIECTPLLDSNKHTLATRVWWIVNNITSWDDTRVQCAECHKPFISKDVMSVRQGYHQFCCPSCATKSAKTQQKRTMALAAQHGDDWKKKWHQKVSDTKHKHFGDAKYNNSQQMAATKRAKAAADLCYWKNIKEKSELTCLQKHGDPHYNNNVQAAATKRRQNNGAYESEQTIEKKKQTSLKHYGVEWSMQSDVCRQKSRQTCLERYGVESCMQSAAVRKKAEQTCLEKYGVMHPAQSRDIRLKSCHQYLYDGQKFDSAPELALYIYLVDNHVPFRFQPNCKLTYFYNGIEHVYCPDFEICGQLVELKGDHLVKVDGTWQCPWDHSKDKLYEAKHQCAIKNNVRIWMKADYKRYLDYVKRRYGSSYLSQFKIRHNRRLTSTSSLI